MIKGYLKPRDTIACTIVTSFNKKGTRINPHELKQCNYGPGFVLTKNSKWNTLQRRSKNILQNPQTFTLSLKICWQQSFSSTNDPLRKSRTVKTVGGTNTCFHTNLAIKLLKQFHQSIQSLFIQATDSLSRQKNN
ncbi:hypothetical protein KR100_01265 [Synechococcus sp. KORDI-100]|nr:hypothetical protein KR100_01265 [Synechococcus sp. KORDI-100]